MVRTAFIFTCNVLRRFCFRDIILSVSIGQGGEVGQRTLLLLLPANHVCLLIGSHLVRLYTRTFRIGKFGIEARLLSASCLSFSDGAKINHMHPRNSRNMPVKTRYFLIFCFCFNFSASVLIILLVELVKKLFHLTDFHIGEGIRRHKVGTSSGVILMMSCRASPVRCHKSHGKSCRNSPARKGNHHDDGDCPLTGGVSLSQRPRSLPPIHSLNFTYIFLIHTMFYLSYILISLFSSTWNPSRMNPCGLLSLRVEFRNLPCVTRLRSVTLFSRMMKRRAYVMTSYG